jgi:hypothetical protein
MNEEFAEQTKDAKVEDGEAGEPVEAGDTGETSEFQGSQEKIAALEAE